MAAPELVTFTEFYRARHKEVLLFARHHAAPYLDVENIVAEAFARACAWWPSLSNPRPWVYRTVINLINDAGAKSQRISPSGDPCLGHETASMWRSWAQSPGPEWGVQVAEISRALQQLPDQQRAAVLLDYRGWSRTEIAAALECTTVTVRGHLHRGRAKLRELLGEPQRTRRQASNKGVEGRTA
jgi:RNA polymerase sigma-70 factor (ECF subfamily)